MQVEAYDEQRDKERLLELNIRLSEFPLPARVDGENFKGKQQKLLMADLKQASSTILTVKEEQQIVGFIQLETDVDWISDEHYAYISRIVLDKAAEGKGFAKALMSEAEHWAKQNGYSAIGLNVFAQNEHAINFYQYLGYEIETMKMVKPLHHD